jgi:REP element-mobilizing transposase RayT
MARPVRIQYADAAYHVTARGNERKAIYRDDDDRRRYLETLAEMADRFGIVIHAYCLMPNHYHLLAQTPRANLSDGIGWLQTTYSIRFNRRHRRSGHLFQGRFKAHLIEEDLYAQALIPYIHLNPVRPRDKRKPILAKRRGELSRYAWSSHRAYAGLGRTQPPDWLRLDWLGYFGRSRAAARAAYRRIISRSFGSVVESPWLELRQGLVLGSDAFWERAKRRLAEVPGAEEIRWRRRADAEQVAATVASLAERQEDHRLAIWLRVRLGGERMTAVAADYDYADGSGVHRVVTRLEEEAKHEPQLARQLQGLKQKMSSVKS